MDDRYSREQAALERQRTLLREAAEQRDAPRGHAPVWRERVAAALIAVALWLAPRG